jgi:ATP-dependent helicase HrpA
MNTPDRLRIDYPEDLPVSARRDEIAAAMAANQVIIVCGETGSGKTTQLPKIALEMALASDGGAARQMGRRRLIGHTQPRRIAASSVAKRIAEELNTPLGEVVGFKVRFADTLKPGARIKLMTDGILLAETQTDRDLDAYSCLIVDEAHERSLNIDFLLGYLHQLLPRRPDLKLIITSATIDAERFARHFEPVNRGGDGRAGAPVPVLMVSGRLYPVEQRYAPVDEGGKDRDLHDAIAEAADALWPSPQTSGDILVFLPGEREIRDAADHLRRRFAAKGARGQNVEVVPLFARLTPAEQEKVFAPHAGRRIVLATNVAETSLTVPGIRYVIDSGLARVKRYSYRNKVEQLQIEPISQAAANQRAGRCGRVANGICIRLYSEADYAGRARFTDPEILRSSLAGVILRMKALGLGDVANFPFIEPPASKAIADGYALLNELGAVADDYGQPDLTPMGRQMARLPLDPRVSRMIIEARERGALREVLVLAASLAVQDPRERPLDNPQAANEKHKPFDDERSEFTGTLKLWAWLDALTGSNRQKEQAMRAQWINPRRVREWRDVHQQLVGVLTEQRWVFNAQPASYEALHLSLLSGLLGNVGLKSDDEDWYLGARGIKFWRHPGVNLSKRPGRWVMAAELVDTARLFARKMAAIEPQWVERVGGHLLKKQLLEPHWEKKAAQVVALERATLYGIVIYSGRRVNFARLDPKTARQIFIRDGLVAAQWDTKLPFLAHNQKLIAQVQKLEHKARRQDVLVDDALIEAFYDAQVPPEVVDGASCERWWRRASDESHGDNPRLLYLTQAELMRHEAAGVTTAAFPPTLRLGGVDCKAEYLHEPGDPRDGVTVTVPLFALNQVSEARCEWLVPGMVRDKVLALCKTLHQRPRSRLVPVPEFAAEFAASHAFGEGGGLMDVLLKAVRERTQLAVQRGDFKLEQLPPHWFMNFRVVDEHGRQLAMGRHLAALKAELGAQARGAFAALAALQINASAPTTRPIKDTSQDHKATSSIHAPSGPIAAQNPHETGTSASGAPGLAADTPYTDWSFGTWPELLEVKRGGHSLVGFPALVDKGVHVEVEVFDDPAVAATRHRAGLRRLVQLHIKDSVKSVAKAIPNLQQMGVAFMGVVQNATVDELREQIMAVSLDRAFLAEPLPNDAVSFKARVEEGRPRLSLISQEVARVAGAVLAEFQAASRKLKDAKPPKEVADDVAAQLQRLVGPRLLVETPWTALQHLPRYLKAVVLRLDKLRADPARDLARLAELRPLEQRFLRTLAQRKGVADARLDEFRWLLEELRVSLFAQGLRTPQPVSVKRLDKLWAQMDAD